jgi:DNA polymerase I-like protein with 3'-5' exonuclease and polymerase domains
MTTALTFTYDDTEEPLPEGVFRVLNSCIAELGLDYKPVYLVPSGAAHFDKDRTTPNVMLSLGKPHPEVGSNEALQLVSGPTPKTIVGHAAGLERLKRAVRLYDMVVNGNVESPLYEYDLVEPNPEYTGSLPGYRDKHGLGIRDHVVPQFDRMYVDIETSGDIKIHQPGDTYIGKDGVERKAELISVGVLLVHKDNVRYQCLDWTREALQDPYCLTRLALLLTCGIPRILHNAQFDLRWINDQLKPYLNGKKVRFEGDTLLKHYTMFPGATGDHGLKGLAQTLLGAPEWENEIAQYVGSNQTGTAGYYERIPPYLLYAYNAGDVYWTWKVDELLTQWMTWETPAFVEKLYTDHVLPTSQMMLDLEDTDAGWPIDMAYAEKLREELSVLAAKQLQKIRMSVGDPTPYLSVAWATQRARWITLHKPLKEKEHQFNPGSWQQVQKWLAAQGVVTKSTDEKHLKEILESGTVPKKVEKFIGRLFAYRHTTKMLSTYVEGVIRATRNGRARPQFKVAGTVTGRLSSWVHTLPRPVKGEPNYRRTFVVEENEVLIGADYGQIEARIVAELTGDPQMIADFQLDQPDFFARQMPGAFPNVFSSMKDVFEMERDDNALYKAMRNQIKPFVHGGNYYRQAAAIAKQYKMPVWQAQQMLDAYMDRYKMVRPWQESVMDYVEGRKINPDFGVPGLWTPFGRRFQQGVITEENDWSVKNSAIAFAPQSIGSDICISAARDLHYNHLHFHNARIVGLIHDAIYPIGPANKAEAIKKITEKRMMAAAAKVFKRVPFPVEAKAGASWADV